MRCANEVLRHPFKIKGLTRLLGGLLLLAALGTTVRAASVDPGVESEHG